MKKLLMTSLAALAAAAFAPASHAQAITAHYSLNPQSCFVPKYVKREVTQCWMSSIPSNFLKTRNNFIKVTLRSECLPAPKDAIEILVTSDQDIHWVAASKSYVVLGKDAQKESLVKSFLATYKPTIVTPTRSSNPGEAYLLLNLADLQPKPEQVTPNSINTYFNYHVKEGIGYAYPAMTNWCLLNLELYKTAKSKS